MDEAALHELLSGRRQGLGASLVRCGLHLASWGFASVMGARNFLYDHQYLANHRAGAPVISIGNLTTGGTGKTPLAAWLANWLTERGHKPALISRGYRALPSSSHDHSSSSRQRAVQGNDEKLVLDRLCPDVPHLQQSDRVSSARRAVAEFGCDALLLDDGFQHRRLYRDLDIVLVDALRPWGYGHVLPRGLLREPLSGLRRADVVILTRANQCSKEDLLNLRLQLNRIRDRDECVEVAFVPSQLFDLDWNSQPLSSIAGKRTIAFCGIGNPTGFRQTVDSLKVERLRTFEFSDHHHYDERDLAMLAQSAHELSADIVVTTQKDLVKISPDSWHGPPLYAVEIGVEFVSGLDFLESQLSRLFKSN